MTCLTLAMRMGEFTCAWLKTKGMAVAPEDESWKEISLL